MRIKLAAWLAALLSVWVSAACAPSAPRLQPATRVEAFCGSKAARMTGVASVMTSTNDRLLDDRPSERDVRQAVRAGDGVIAHWNAQAVQLPATAAKLGETDGYARVDAVAVPLAAAGALSRHIYLLARDHGSSRWITLEAFDVQNVCVEGKRES